MPRINPSTRYNADSAQVRALVRAIKRDAGVLHIGSSWLKRLAVLGGHRVSIKAKEVRFSTRQSLVLFQTGMKLWLVFSRLDSFFYFVAFLFFSFKTSRTGRKGIGRIDAAMK